ECTSEKGVIRLKAISTPPILPPEYLDPPYRAGVLFWPDRPDCSQSLSGRGRHRHSISGQRLTACAVPLWRRSDDLPVCYNWNVRAEDPRIGFRFDDHRLSDGAAFWPGVLRLGLPTGNRAGMVRGDWPQAV